MIFERDRLNPNRRDKLTIAGALSLVPLLRQERVTDERSRLLLVDGAIVRGLRVRKQLALVFTGDLYAEGARAILDALHRRALRSAWFVTGRFLRKPEFASFIRRAVEQGHDLGPHSDQHLLYASWDQPPKLLISREQFLADLSANVRALAPFVREPGRFPYFLPPYEHHTTEIARWTSEAGRILINHTRGTLSHTDYMEDDDRRFVTARDIVASILRAERTGPNGLRGYILLMHLGAGPRRTRDHLHDLIDALLDGITDRGYTVVRLPELLRSEDG
jgi:peptidoglycan/xylan/chitin deacetylase (PgdA/CDA1 family)